MATKPKAKSKAKPKAIPVPEVVDEVTNSESELLSNIKDPDPPLDQYEILDEVVRQATIGNPHIATKLLVEVVRGLL